MNTVPTMAISFVGLFVLAGLAVGALMAAIGTVALLTHSRARDIARILVVGLGAFALLAVLCAGMYLGVSRQRTLVQHQAARARAAQELAHLRQVQEQIDLDGRSAATDAAAAAETQPAAKKTDDEATTAAEETPKAEAEPAEPTAEGKNGEKDADAKQTVDAEKAPPSDS
ncbi:MAG: hypothetical protein ACYC6Y_31020, partial [Thermoguttaceae bacterium]